MLMAPDVAIETYAVCGDHKQEALEEAGDQSAAAMLSKAQWEWMEETAQAEGRACRRLWRLGARPLR